MPRKWSIPGIRRLRKLSVRNSVRSLRNSFKSTDASGFGDVDYDIELSESYEDASSTQSVSSQELRRREYFAIYLQRCFRYYKATVKWRWLKQKVMTQHRLALNLYHESELADLAQAMHLYKIMRATYLAEKTVYKRNTKKLQVALDRQLENEQNFYTDEIVWRTSKLHSKQEKMLRKLKTKLTNPKRAREWIIKLYQGHTFDDMVKEINFCADPTANDYRNPQSKRKRVLTFHEANGQNDKNVLLRPDLIVRDDHGVAFDTWHNAMTYNQDLDLHLTNEYCKEINRMRADLDNEIAKIGMKRKKAIRGIQNRYSNRFHFLRYNYKSQRKEICALKRSAERKIVGFRVVLLAIGHSIIDHRAAQKNYIPDELLQKAIREQLDLYEADKQNPRYIFIEKYKKYYAKETEKRNVRLHDYFSQKINAFTDFWDELDSAPLSRAGKEELGPIKESESTDKPTHFLIPEVGPEPLNIPGVISEHRPMSGLHPRAALSTPDPRASLSTPMKSRGLSSGESLGKFSSDEDSRGSPGSNRLTFTPDPNDKGRGEVTFKTEVRTVVIEEGKHEPSWSSNASSEYETVPMNDVMDDILERSSRVSTGKMKIEMDRNNEEFESMRQKMMSIDSDTTDSSELSNEITMDEEERKLRSAQWGHISGDDNAKVMLHLSGRKASPLIKTEGRLKRTTRKLNSSGKHNKLKFTPTHLGKDVGQEEDVFSGMARARVRSQPIKIENIDDGADGDDDDDDKVDDIVTERRIDNDS